MLPNDSGSSSGAASHSSWCSSSSSGGGGDGGDGSTVRTATRVLPNTEAASEPMYSEALRSGAEALAVRNTLVICAGQGGGQGEGGRWVEVGEGGRWVAVWREAGGRWCGGRQVGGGVEGGR